MNSGDGSAVTHLEIERKLAAPPGWIMPDITGTGRVVRAGEPQILRQEAIYFDTADLDLLTARHTLRRRTGGSDPGWHLKKPGTGDCRLEMNAPLGESLVRVPGSLREEITALAGPVMLMPVCRMRTTRVRHHLIGPGGEQDVIALVEDDTVEAEALRSGRVRHWRELEIELAGGDQEDLEAIIATLTRAGAQASASASKLARAMAGEQGLLIGDTAGGYVLRYLIRQIGTLQALEPAVRRDGPDAVHKSRVAIRRLRATLHTYRRLFEPAGIAPLRDELRWAGELFGGPRDAEVMRERLSEHIARLDPGLVRGDVAQRVRSAMTARHARAHADLVAGLDGQRYEQLMSALITLVEHPPWRGRAARQAAEVVPAMAGAAVAAVAAQAAAVPRDGDAPGRQETVHEVRKCAKVARYAVEAAGELAGERAADVVSAWTGVQDALGEHQDSVVAREALEAVYRQALAAGEDTFTYGVLVLAEARRAREIEEGFDALLAEVLATSSCLEPACGGEGTAVRG